MSERELAEPGRESEGKRDASKRQTRLALVEAATSEFLEKGFDAPSLDAICARAGFTRGAFYVHFKNREDLVAAVMEHVIDHVVESSVGSGSDLTSFESMVRRFVSVSTSWSEGARPGNEEAEGDDLLSTGLAMRLHQMLEACQRAESVRDRLVSGLAVATQRITETLQRAQDAGEVRRDVPADAIANLLLLLALGTRVVADLGIPMDVVRTPGAAILMFAAPRNDTPQDREESD